MNSIFKTAQLITKSRTFNVYIFSLITFSAILIGIETYPDVASRYRDLIVLIDRFIIACFVLEIGLKIIAFGNKPFLFFKDPWNVFDFVIFISLTLSGASHADKSAFHITCQRL